MILTRKVKIQLVVFLVLSAVGIIYTGLAFIGIHPFNGPYPITVQLSDSGGIFKNAQVSYRGVTIGKVSGLRLIKGGVAADLSIDHGVQIPQDSNAKIANLSAVGEQYVDIEPQTSQGPYLTAGGVIPMSRTSGPISDTTLLLNLDQLVSSVDRKNLSIVIDELGKGFTDTGPNLQRLIDNGNVLTKAAQNALPQTKALIDDGKTVLDTQNATANDLRSFTSNLAQLSAQLVVSDPDLRNVIDNGIPASNELTSLINMNKTQLPLLLDNLTTLGHVQAARLPGLKSLLVLYPEDVANGFFAAAGGYAHFGLVTTSNPPVCSSSNGFYNSENPKAPNISNYDNSPSTFHKRANLNTYCIANPHGTNAPDVRGSQQAPRPAGDDTGKPTYRPYVGRGTVSRSPVGDSNSGTGHSTVSSNNSSASSGGASSSTSSIPGVPFLSGNGTLVSPYNSTSGLATTPNGQSFRYGENPALRRLLGNDGSLEWLLVAPTIG